MLVGVDFDNTIVCYDRLFHALAVERGLIPAEVPANKTAVRDYLRSVGREDDWTELQGVAYGPEIVRAEPFTGVLNFFRECRRRGIPTVIISHKTRHPYRGERHDLHASARAFLRQHGFLHEADTGLNDANVFLELTKEAKLARIAAADCTHFIDDLPEFLGEANFPSGVVRILFDPERLHPTDARWRRMPAWGDAFTMLGTIVDAGPSPPVQPSTEAVAQLLNAAGLQDAGFALAACAGGGNNRGFKLSTADGRTFFLKWYFRHPDDPRDRLGTEFAFASFCRSRGIDEVPQPLARDDADGLALYEFIEGRRLSPDEIDETAVDAAASFFVKLNEHRNDNAAAALPIASEACFSIDEHLTRIGGRIDRLATVAAEPDADSAFRAFVADRLVPCWHEVRRRVDAVLPPGSAERSASLTSSQRRLSPSDFGFHNILRMQNGRLRVLDLEYAGWDDPAKTVCDFFCQVQVPVPRRFWARVVERIAGDAASRAELLLPAYRLKWCCIILNVFLPAGSARRAFGTAAVPSPERRAEQLRQAVVAIESLQADFRD